ncbi:single-stranded-DNA-specific exonuclease RecJ [Desulfothermobacter acidiphilus]|uniref:single-stranded-DNA-specific exonuclease RecJ n=1 Tax=Desulfothermobacter acidiphilus TaxID=1938353 RepID=UPI003F8A017D
MTVRVPAPQLALVSAWWARELGVEPALIRILLQRGVKTLEEAEFFLRGSLSQLPPPLAMRDMERAVARLRAAVAAGEKVLVWGDYDADGVTATVLLVTALRRLGLEEVSYHLPTRAEGYGLQAELLRRVREQGVSLVVTVDCGVQAHEEAQICCEMGLDLLITDHHEPPEELPRAQALINPRRRDCAYPFKELAGVGVAYKLASALLPDMAPEGLDLVALGTVADVMPLLGENRVLVKEGLRRLNSSPVRPGIAALLKVAGVAQPASVRTLSHVLAPRLNAAGRIGDPDVAARCLLAGQEEANEWARRLEELNRVRQQQENAVLAEAIQLVEASHQAATPILLVDGENWPPGLTGLVAQRLHSLYRLPAFVVAWEGDTGRGSGRAPETFHVFRALSQVAPHLLDYGGHAGAAGFAVSRSAWPKVVEALRRYASALPAQTQPAEPEADLELTLEELTTRLVQDLRLLEPYGPGNPPPRLLARRVELLEARRVGRENEHLRLRLRQGGAIREGIAFGQGGKELPRWLDLVFEPSINELTGAPELKVLECWPASGSALPAPPSEQVLLHRAAVTLALPFDAHLPEAQPALPRQVYQRGVLVDWRNHPQRWEQLLELLQEPAAVVVATPARACEVAARLSLLLPGRAGEIFLFHAGLSSCKNLLVQLARDGCLPVLVTTPALGGRFAPERNVILFDLLFSREQWDWLRRSGGKRLVLLYGDQDRESARRRLQLLALPRSALLSFYRFLREKAGAQGELRLKREEALLQLRRMGLLSPGQETLRVGLQILSELGLVQLLTNGDRDWRIRLQKPPRRRFLSQAPTFTSHHAWKRQVLLEQRRFLEASAEELKEFFHCAAVEEF